VGDQDGVDEAVLGMPAEAVRVARHRALARMRKLLAGEPG
jgi:DNA-directed RNA polymerase specialized sigma24 family protein